LGFQELVLPDVIPVEIPPPDLSMPAISAADFSGIGVRGGRADGDSTVTSVPADLSAAPTFTPFEVVPEVRNREQVSRALQRAYPPLLRSARVGGTAVVWFFINTQGVVEKSQVSRSSGYAQLDQAALDVASVFEFTPAMNRDERVSVWIEIPIVFQIER
jgi:protein TonB